MKNTAQTERKTIKDLKRPLMVGTVVLAGLVATYGLNASYKKQDVPEFLIIKDFPNGASVEGFLETRNGTTDLASQDGVISLPSSLNNSLATPYRIRSSVRLPNDSYRDFTVTVAPDNKDISVVADGFHAGDLVSMTLNGRDTFRNMPADWSGKLELTAILPKEKSVTACIDIAGQTESLGLCHVIAERRPL